MTPADETNIDDSAEPRQEGLGPTDIYYVLFRHKGKILACALAGIAAAAFLFFTRQPVYKSEATLLIPYVRERENRPMDPAATEARTRPTDPGGLGIINSELAILKSFDLATAVAQTIGPEKILLGQSTKAGNLVEAAAVIKKNLVADAAHGSGDIYVTFQHPDPNVVQRVLKELIIEYKKKHLKIHLEAGVSDEFFTEKADELRGNLARTDEELRTLYEQLGVASLDEAKKANAGQMARIRGDLLTAQMKLAARKAELDEIKGTAPTNSTKVAEVKTTSAPPLPRVKQEEYGNIVQQLTSARNKQAELLRDYTGESILVKGIREQITGLEEKKKKLEEENPGLVKMNVSPTGNAAGPAANKNPLLDSAAAATEISGLNATIQILTSQLAELQTEAGNLETTGAKIIDLLRQREVWERGYRNYKASLEQSHIDEKLPNIKVTEDPTPPFMAASKTKKNMLMALAGGIFGGIGWAFLIELVLDRSVRRPKEVTNKLGLPLFLSIPFAPNGHSRLPVDAPPTAGAGQNQLAAKSDDPPEEASRADSSPGETGAAVAPWETRHGLRAYYEALRNRLITHFEISNMTHKPKMIAITSCSKGAGVTSTATGLAATLSETGEGNVLLVDMNLKQGAAHPFYKGRPACGLSDVLEGEKRNPALVSENLYLAVANQTSDKLSRMLPKRFTELVPKLKMSDYDYIIFDMPAVSQTSVTPVVAAYMDMVLLVIESEKTNRDVVEQARSLLAESGADAKAVLNKYRRYVPDSLCAEL